MTRTEQFLKALAEGDDAPISCCMTNTQSLLADAVTRVNGLQEDIEAFIPITNNEIDAIAA